MKTIFLNFPELDEALKEAKKLSNKNSEKGFAMAVFIRKVFSKPLLQNQC